MNKLLNGLLIRQPLAWLPLVLSLVALLLIFAYVALYGMDETGGDDGPAAGLFQVLLLLQICVMASFALRWLPIQPRPALRILFIQCVAWIVPVALILWLED